MKKRQNRIAQIGALVALVAIVMSIVGTALIFIFSSDPGYHSEPTVNQISEEELQEYLDSLPDVDTSQELSEESTEESNEVSE